MKESKAMQKAVPSVFGKNSMIAKLQRGKKKEAKDRFETFQCT